MNKLEEYLAGFSGKKSLYIIGPLASEIAEVNSPLVYIDGGTRLRKGCEGFSLGDGDSFDGELDLKLNKDKDFSDLSFALKYIPENFSEIHLIGFLGGRRDHELMNLGEASLYLKTRLKETQVFFDESIIALSKGNFNLSVTSIFSLFGFEDNEVSITGDCKYPFTGEVKGLTSHGLSNIGSGEISIITSKPLLLLKII